MSVYNQLMVKYKYRISLIKKLERLPSHWRFVSYDLVLNYVQSIFVNANIVQRITNVQCKLD